MPTQKQHFRLLALGIIVSQLLMCITPALAESKMRVFADDTIAGWSTELRSSVGPAQSAVVFEINKPDSSVIKLETETNQQGVAEIEFLGFHTKKTGEYRARVYVKGETAHPEYSTFTVYPETTSTSKSDIYLSESALQANDKDQAEIRVTLRDDYGNPIPNHYVDIISSRVEDRIVFNKQQTDQSGQISAKISANSPGISSLIAQDKTAGVILTTRPQITFFNSESSHSAQKNFGNYIMANVLYNDDNTAENSDTEDNVLLSQSNNIPANDNFDLYGELDHFGIEIIPSLASDGNNVLVNENIGVKVRALDVEDRVVSSYTGTIRFSASDQNATLPDDYEFNSADLGEKTLSLSIKLTSLGRQKIEVVDINDWFKTGSLELNVAESIGSEGPQNSEIIIKNPDSNVTLNQTTVTVSGQGPANIGLDIFVNGALVNSTDIDSDGFFSSSIIVEEGQNKVFAIEQNGKERKSNTINFMVDISPPSINSFQVIPEGDITVGEFYSVILRSEPGLDKAAIKVQVEHPLVQNLSEPDKYEATLSAPLIKGEYPIYAILTDGLGNKLETNTNRILRVVDKDLPLPTVTGLKAQAGNESVLLEWDDMTKNQTEAISKYKIYFGEGMNTLSKNLTSEGPSNSLVINNLDNDKKYYFAVTALNDTGQESSEKSEVVSATPNSNAGFNIPSDSKLQLRGVGGNSRITLSWDPFPGIQAYRYKIYYGLQSGNYNSYILSDVNQSSLVIGDLANGITYYATVSPINSDGIELNIRSNEVAATPSALLIKGPDIQNNIPIRAPQVDLSKRPIGQVGPESLWIIFLSLAAAQTGLIIRKKLLKQ